MPLGAIVLKQNSHSPGLWEVKEFFHKLPFFLLQCRVSCIPRNAWGIFKIKSFEWYDKKKLKHGAASLWKLFDTLSRSVTHKLHISAGTVHGFMAVLLFCFYVCTRLISHPTTFINQEGKFLWSHCNKDSPVISFMDICRTCRCGHSSSEWKWKELVLSKHPNSV